MTTSPLARSSPLFAALAFTACSPVPEEVRKRAEPDAYAYPDGAPVTCAQGSRAGPAGATEGGETAGGRAFAVRAPTNYRAEVAHPLLVVYAAAGSSPRATEFLWGFTRAATRAGFLVAYPEHGIGAEASEDLGTVPGLVARRWCVDERRVFLTGHSDGGLASTAVAFLEKTRDVPAAIAPSGAGIRGEDLVDYECPGPLPVMVMHSAEDELFAVPRYGLSAAQWWARCNGCEPTYGAPDEDGCVSFESCAAGAPTRYCKGRGPHVRVPRLREAILAFFQAAPDNPAGSTAVGR